MLEFKFNHESETIPHALGFSDELDDVCRERVIFSTVSSHYITQEFFDDEDQVPKNLNTITGILQKCLETCKNENEQLYTLLIFRTEFDTAAEAIAKYKLYHSESEQTQKKMKIMMELVELKALMDKEDDRKDLITPKDLFRKIEIAKKNLYSFEDYYKEIKNNA